MFRASDDDGMLFRGVNEGSRIALSESFLLLAHQPLDLSILIANSRS